MLKETLVALFGMLQAGSGAPAPAPAASAPATPAAAAADSAPGRPLTADQIVDQVQRFYERTQSLKAKFRQRYTNTTFGKTTTSSGWVYVKKPGKMRWNYYEKAPGRRKPVKTKSFVSDGVTLWAIEHDNKQAFKKDLEKDLLPVAVTFLTGKGDLRRDFTAELDTSGTYGGKDDYVVKLTPKKPSAQYKTLWLVVARDNFRVRQSIVLEASGNTNAFAFYEPQFDAALPDRLFAVDERALRRHKFRIIEPDERETKSR
ncbi:MAG: outer membrane lipoprotein carrier protein LolA [Deltaproteobacteria bacterium]|nr:MAG: outer membrane lipoprotein carrier protein LolA [Deltaproteobacteria bacterium]